MEDSSNSAGVVIDALRCAKLGLDRGVGGPLEAPSAYYMKSPPRQFRDSVARDACNAFIDELPFELPRAAPQERKGCGPVQSLVVGLRPKRLRSTSAIGFMMAAIDTLLFDFGGTLDADGVAVEGPLLRPLPGRGTRHDRRGVRVRLLRRR